MRGFTVLLLAIGVASVLSLTLDPAKGHKHEKAKKDKHAKLKREKEQKEQKQEKESEGDEEAKPEKKEVPQMILATEENAKHYEKPATVDVYVINMADRDERWRCAQKMLAGSPYQVNRFEAIVGGGSTPIEGENACPHLAGVRLGQGTGAKGVLCSNYKIWEKSLNSTSDFVIIFEDDIAVSADIWSRVQDLLNGPCATKFDYVAVDTFHGAAENRSAVSPHGKKTICNNAVPGLGLHELVGVGAHMQILRQSSIQKMIEVHKQHPKEEADQLPKKWFNQKYDLVSAMFQAKIAAQYRSAKQQNVEKVTKCQGPVGRPSIKGPR